MAHLRLRLMPVRAQAEDQGHIGQVNAASLQLCQQGRENSSAPFLQTVKARVKEET